jgi:hypothetical protein
MWVVDLKEGDDQEIIDLAEKITLVNRAKVAQSATYQSPALNCSTEPIIMARPGQPAIHQYFNGTAINSAVVPPNNNNAPNNDTALSRKPAEVSEKPVDDESKERLISQRPP